MSRHVPREHKVSTRALVLAGIVVAFLIAGVASFYASSDPDGLTKVSQEKGFASSADDHGAADGPLAGYETKGVGNARLSGGMAGVVGSLVVLVLAGGTVVLVRRRRPADAS
jgi:cobalt/nickel transport system permease protein/cobalt/nickel transport protein